MKDNHNSHTREWIMFAEIPNARTKIISAPIASGPMRKQIRLNRPLILRKDFLIFLWNIFSQQMWNSSSQVKRDNFYMEHLPVI